MTGIDWSKCLLCQSDPEKMGGVWTLRGIRISADQIIEKWEDGVETIDIAERFDLDLDDVEELLAFARTAPRLVHSV